MRALAALTVTAIMVFAGCIQVDVPEAIGATTDTTTMDGITSVIERHNLPFNVTNKWSRTLVEGAFGILPALNINVAVDVPLGNGLPTQNVNMGLFLPDIPGCPFGEVEGDHDLASFLHEMDSFPAECQVPVISDIGPYYGEAFLGDLPATEPARRLGGFLIENFVPHGYAVAQVSVLGTGGSDGCMDLMGPTEQAGVQGAVDWLGSQPWSNGAVGLIGRSYDGSTPWEAAMNGSPYLKTVVPISGLTGVHGLTVRNGSMEDRGSGLLWALYFSMSYTGSEDQPTTQAQQAATNSICADTLQGPAQGQAAYATGDMVAPEANDYWTSREFGPAVLDNYEGSVYYIHGMQDWNVDPHMAFPFYNQLEAKGLDIKGLFGQWQHMYPDRLGEHGNCGYCPSGTSVRYDWAQDLLEWFNHYLKGTGPKPELHVEMQDASGGWRIEETWPPADVAWVEQSVADMTLDSTDNILVPTRLNPALGIVQEPIPQQDSVVYTLPAHNGTLKIAGLTQFHVDVTPLGPGGQLYVALIDVDEGRRLGHAIMDLRYAAGGKEMQPVVAGQTITAMMEFFPMDVVVPEGHTLELRIMNTGAGYMPSTVSDPVVIEGGVLRLPVIDRGVEDYFTPPQYVVETAE